MAKSEDSAPSSSKEQNNEPVAESQSTVEKDTMEKKPVREKGDIFSKLTSPHPVGFVIYLLLGTYITTVFSSYFGLLVLLFCIYTYYYAENRRMFQEVRKRRNVILTTMKDIDILQAAVGDGTAPPWIVFPDREHSEWFNTIIKRLWPQLKIASEEMIDWSMQPILDWYRPTWMTQLAFEKIDMGSIPPVITGIKVHDKEGPVLWDLDIEYAGNCYAIINCGLENKYVSVKISDIQLAGMLRLTLAPKSKYYPGFSAISVSFMEKPYIDFNIEALSMNIMSIPGLAAWLQTFIKDILAWMIVYPKNAVWPFWDIADELIADLAHPEPVGVLRVHVIEAVDLVNLDTIGKSDPYVIMKVGDEEQKTRVIDDSLAPCWDERFEFVVHDKETSILYLKLYDDERFGKPQNMGRCEVELGTLRDLCTHDIWLDLQDIRSGKLRVKLTWVPISKQEEDEGQEGSTSGTTKEEKEDMALHRTRRVYSSEADSSTFYYKLQDSIEEDMDQLPISKVPSSFSSAILLVYIDKCEDLVPSDSNGLADPYAVITLGDQKEKTWIAKGTLDPEFKQRFQMRVSDPDRDVLHIQLFDYDRFGKDDFMGELLLPVRSMKKSRCVKDVFDLNAVKQGRIHLNLTYRKIVPTDLEDLQQDM